MAGRYRRLFTDQQLIELHERGFNDTEIGKKLGAHKITVGEHRRRLGLKAHDPRRLFTDQQLKELHEQGFNDREIGEKLGIGTNTVNIHRRKLGLKAHGRAR
jgi:DNA-binding NarL/FixJ family response regulator